MDGVGGINGNVPTGSTNQPQQSKTPSQPSAVSAEEQAAFEQAVEQLAVAELLTDFFVVEQPIIDEINKESSK